MDYDDDDGMMVWWYDGIPPTLVVMVWRSREDHWVEKISILDITLKLEVKEENVFRC